MSTVYFRFIARSSDNALRSPLLEALILRADGQSPVADWRADAFAAISVEALPPPAVGVAVWHAVAGTASRASPGATQGAAMTPGAAIVRWACVATPVHMQAGLSSVTLAQEGLLTLDVAEAARLALEFNTLWRDEGLRLVAGPAGVLVCAVDRLLEVIAPDVDTIVGSDLFGAQPTGPDGPQLRRWMSEIELWLFEHAINRERAAAGRPTITGLWPWGGGPTAASLPRIRGFTVGSDPLFAALGASAAGGERPGTIPGPGVIVIDGQPGSAAWEDAERRWMQPAVDALAAGRVDRLAFSAGDRCFSVTNRRRWAFWRRPRPWWESFGC